jgi:hypothetical protein
LAIPANQAAALGVERVQVRVLEPGEGLAFGLKALRGSAQAEHHDNCKNGKYLSHRLTPF